MKKIISTIIVVFLILTNIQAQDVRTYTNYSIGGSFGKKINSYQLYLGETLELHAKTPFRFSAGVNLKANYLQKSANQSVRTILPTLNVNSRAVYFGFPVGIELFKGNFGIGASQEIFNLSFRKEYDSTQINTKSNYLTRTGNSSFIFSKNNTLSNNVYAVVTVSESFSIKLGMNTDHFLLSFYDQSNKKSGTNRYTSTGIFISLRTNIEK